MEGRPYLRFLYVENAIGDMMLTTTPAGDVIESPIQRLPIGKLGQLAFVSDDDTNKYDTSYLLRLATVVHNHNRLDFVQQNANPLIPIYDMEQGKVYTSNYTTASADILFLVDGSGSMSGPMAKLKANIAGLYTTLAAEGITDLRTALATYIETQKQLLVGTSPWATYTMDAMSLFYNLSIMASAGAHCSTAIKWAVETYKFRDNAKKCIVLVSDTTREGDALTPEDIQQLLIDNSISLYVVAQDASYYTPTTSITGGEFIDINSASDWYTLLSDALGNALSAGIIGSGQPLVWNIQTHPENIGQDLAPAQDAGIGHLVYDSYHKTLWYVQPDGSFLLIARQQDVNKQIIQSTAATAITVGQLVAMDTAGRVMPASKEGNKAVGYAMASVSAGSIVDVQVGGVYTDYTRWVLTPGTVYYQDDNGEIRWQDVANDTHKYPAALAVSPNSFVILTEIYMGGGSGGGGTITVEALTVKRDQRTFSDNTMALTEACSLAAVMEDIFQTTEWASMPYMLKQILTITNVSNIASLQFDVRHAGGTSVIDSIPAKGSVTVAPLSADWSLFCRGDYTIDLIIETVSGKLPPVISTTPPSNPTGLNIYEYTDPSDGTKKYVVIGQIKRFSIVTDPSLDTTGLLFDIPAWIDANIDSPDYLLLGSIRLINESTSDADVLITDTNDVVLYSMSLPAGKDVTIDLHREDIKFKALLPGSIKADIMLQVTAYKFKAGV